MNNMLFYERFLATRMESRPTVAEELHTKERGLTPTDTITEEINSVIRGVKRMAGDCRLPENTIAMLYLRNSGIRL
jgi:hypothetical protein